MGSLSTGGGTSAVAASGNVAAGSLRRVTSSTPRHTKCMVTDVMALLSKVIDDGSSIDAVRLLAEAVERERLG